MKYLYFSQLIIFALSALAPANARAQEGSTPYFTAYQDGNSAMVTIRWQLMTEANTDHYVLEHATDTREFSPMHELVARGGEGEGPSYRDEDNNAGDKLNYYRLRIVGKDGNAFYSPAVRVDMTGKIPPAIKPTVLNMGSTLRLNTYYSQPLTVNFFNESGRMIATFLVNSSSFDVNTSAWGKGMFIYRFSDPAHPLISAGKILIP
jgi:hypothetical protein